MSNKKAFTMVELMGVIIILSIILLMAVPTITETLRTTQQKDIAAFLKSVYVASETYVEGHIDMFKLEGVDAKDFILLNELVDNAYLNGEMINPSTKKFIKLETSIIEIVKNTDGIIEYKYVYSGLNSLITIDDIEGLVRLSKSVNGGDGKSGLMFHLTKNLDFLNSSSYTDANDVSFGDINENGTIEPIKVELTTGKGFKPIGKFDSEFMGGFYGRNKIISNLYINRPDEDDVGLFGSIKSGFVNSIVINGGNVNGKNRVGLGVGSLFLGAVAEDIETTGYVNNTGHSLGGVVGFTNGSEVANCLSSANIKGVTTTESGFGGIIGSLRLGSTIKNSTFDGTVESDSINTGGIVGFADASIINKSTFNGRVVGKNPEMDNVGGIVGSAIANSYVTSNVSKGSITGNGFNNGGIVGKLDTSSVTGSTFTGNLASNSFTKTGTGGIVGWMINNSLVLNSSVDGIILANAPNLGGISGTIEESTVDGVTFSGTVTGIRLTSTGIGGIAGYTVNNSFIKNSTSSGTISGKAGNVGGISGSLNTSTIVNSLFEGSVTSDSITGSGFGGISGFTYSASRILNSISLGSINGGKYNTGGITGTLNESQINSCYSGATILGRDGVGGLVGYSLNNALVKNSYSLGTVEGIDSVGGISGATEASILETTYSLANVIGSSYIGGITGIVVGETTINNSYATGAITVGYKYGAGSVGYEEVGAVATYSNLYFYDNQVVQNIDGTPYIAEPPVPIYGNTVTIADLRSITWQQDMLGNYFYYTTGNYPRLYKDDGFGNPTSVLLDRQQIIAVN